METLKMKSTEELNALEEENSILKQRIDLFLSGSLKSKCFGCKAA